MTNQRYYLTEVKTPHNDQAGYVLLAAEVEVRNRGGTHLPKLVVVEPVDQSERYPFNVRYL